MIQAIAFEPDRLATPTLRCTLELRCATGKTELTAGIQHVAMTWKRSSAATSATRRSCGVRRRVPAETCKQWMGKGEPNPAKSLDGYGWVRKATSLRGSDPEMEFAGALITFSGSERDRNDHVEKAMAGAKTDPLFAQNLASYFNRRTTAETLRYHPAEEVKEMT
jgi:hypothetical protein